MESGLSSARLFAILLFLVILTRYNLGRIDEGLVTAREGLDLERELMSLSIHSSFFFFIHLSIHPFLPFFIQINIY